MKKTILFLIPCTLLILSGCTKEGTGGKAVIEGTVNHHSAPIPGTVVYIKYGTKESPGTNVTYYDASVTADANAHYSFTNLKKGDYFLFGVGFDSAIAEVVYGGIPIRIKGKTETVKADIPVTE